MSIAARSMDFAVRFERGGVWRVGSLNLAFAKDLDDVTPLRALRGLRCLSLSSTYVTDVSPLAACTELVELNLSNTSVADVSALGRLRKLELLDLGRTFVEDASPLAGCVALHTLKLPARSGAPPRAPQSREDGNGSTGVERPLDTFEICPALQSLTCAVRDSKNSRDPWFWRMVTVSRAEWQAGKAEKL